MGRSWGSLLQLLLNMSILIVVGMIMLVAQKTHLGPSHAGAGHHCALIVTRVE